VRELNKLHLTGWKKAEEIGKCEVVCSNCHRERTHKRMVMETKSSISRRFVVLSMRPWKAYENAFGELKIPESETKPQRDAAEIEHLIAEAREKKRAAQEALTSTPSSTEKKPPAKRSRGASEH
jgi:hypothetical protein